jgi:hypothetical protein
MENLIIEATKSTPKIILDCENNKFVFKGKSYPENTKEFYAPVAVWIDNYFKQFSDKNTTIEFDINYLNSSSIKFFFDIFDIFEQIQSENNILKVKWFYDKDDDMGLEIGEDFVEDYENLHIELTEK